MQADNDHFFPSAYEHPCIVDKALSVPSDGALEFSHLLYQSHCPLFKFKILSAPLVMARILCISFVRLDFTKLLFVVSEMNLSCTAHSDFCCVEN